MNKAVLGVVGGVVAGVLGLPAAALAQPFTINWYTVDGGGGTSSGVLPGGATISISGTIGQPDAGPIMAGGTFSLTGGFWAGGTPTPTPCDPDLNQDGNADQDDVAYLVNVIAGGPNPTGIDPDFNHDGNADQDDLAALINVVAGGSCP